MNQNAQRLLILVLLPPLFVSGCFDWNVSSTDGDVDIDSGDLDADSPGHDADQECTSPSCSDGDSSNCTFEACGEECCEFGEICSILNQCCTPDCSGRLCGDDGCGRSCGECPSNSSCGEDGRCHCSDGFVPDRSGALCLQIGSLCGAEVTAQGHCAGENWVRCTPDGVIILTDCVSEGFFACDEFSGSCGCNPTIHDSFCFGDRNEFKVFCAEGYNVLMTQDCVQFTGTTNGFCSFIQGSTVCVCGECLTGAMPFCHDICDVYIGECSYDFSTNTHICD